MHKKIFMWGLCVLIIVGTLTACGKRGDPFRPSEIAKEQTGFY